MPKCIFLVGIPTSGKSTYVRKNFCNKDDNYAILSRDYYRDCLRSNSLPISESLVTAIFETDLRLFVDQKCDIVIDNTNLKMKYINNIKSFLTEDYEIQYIKFPISKFKAKYRNIIRWIKTGKWIPMRVIDKMWEDYQIIDIVI